MTKLFEQAIGQVSQLTDEEQNAIAQIILEELDEEARWDQAFAQSALLAQLAQEAEQEEQNVSIV